MFTHISLFNNLTKFFFSVNQVYAKIKDDVVNFFYGQGITIITIQPEFDSTQLTSKLSGSKCLVECLNKDCIQKSCCANATDDDIQIEIVSKPTTYSDEEKQFVVNDDVDNSLADSSKTEENVGAKISHTVGDSSGKAKLLLCLNVSQLTELHVKPTFNEQNNSENNHETVCNKKR